MKILLSAYACEPGRGSEPGNGWNWAVHLAMRGHTVHVLTTPRGQAAIEQARISLSGGARLPRLDFTYVDVPQWAKQFFNRAQLLYLIWQQVVLRSARRLDATYRFDLVHHVTWGSLRGGSELWRLGIPFVFGPLGGGQTAPTGFESDFGRAWTSERVRTFLTRRVVPFSPILRRVARNTALVLATNLETMDLARRLGAMAVEFFPDAGLPEVFFPARMPTRPGGPPFRLLWVGRLLPLKAVSLALAAIENVPAGVDLTIVGDGPDRGRVLDYLRGSPQASRVDWRGQVPWEGMRDAYESHDALLFTSLRDSFGAQILEAMAFGLPIITLNHHGARDLVPDGAGIKVDVGTREETLYGLVKAIERLQEDASLRVAMGKAGYEFAKTHTWPHRADAMGVLYGQLVGGA